MFRRGVLFVVLTLAVFAGGAAGQHLYASLWPHTVSWELAISPCGPNNTQHASPVVYQEGLFVFYHCHDERQFLRRFAQDPLPVVTPPPIDPILAPANPCAANPGWVQVGDGCLPPDHPYARRR